MNREGAKREFEKKERFAPFAPPYSFALFAPSRFNGEGDR